MNTYLAIITTALVLTQILRCTQNHIQLRRQGKLFREQLGELGDITQEDLEQQRETYRMLYRWLKRKETEE